MRWADWILVVAIFAGHVGSAFGYESGGAGCHGTAMFGQPSPSALGGGACCSPSGYTLVPGCCEYYHPCCDNAWSGYCEHRAKVQAFWSRVGAPKPPCRHFSQWFDSPEMIPYSEEPMPDVRPTPAIPPAPAAPVEPQVAPKKTAWRSYRLPAR